jgi:phosphoribosylpyrophosphate synthetase
MNKDRYDYHIMDAFNKKSVSELETKHPDGFDIIIEDGPHTLESQIFAVQNYTQLLKDGGILIIEDVITTGSSINRCAELLIKNGAKKVIILAITRVEGELKI